MAKTYLVRFGTDNPATYTGLSPTFTKFFNSAGTATTAPSISEIASSGMYSFSYNPLGFIGFILDGTASMGANVRYVAGALDPNDLVSDTGTSLVAMGASLSVMGTSLTAQGNTISVMGASMSVMGNSLAVMGNSLSVMGGSLSVMGASLTAQGNTISVIGFSMGIMGGSLSAMGVSVAAMGVSIVAMGNTVLVIGQSTSVLALGSAVTALGVTVLAQGALLGDTGASYGGVAVDPTTLFGFMKRIQELQEGDSSYAKGTGVWSIYNRGSTNLLRTKTLADASTTVTKV